MSVMHPVPPPPAATRDPSPHRDVRGLTDEYRRTVRSVEDLPVNRDGTDKSWVWEAVEQARRHFHRAVPR